MFKFLVALLFLFTHSLSFANPPTEDFTQEVASSVFRIQVSLKGGGMGFGSGVMIAKDKIVTNCHVVAKATSIVVMYHGQPHTATAITPDWHHDVCLLTVPFFEGAIAKTNSNHTINNEDVFNVGFPGHIPVKQVHPGKINGLFLFDKEYIIQTTSAFSLGESGGGLFNSNGELIGIITLKSPEPESFYYNMPVSWAINLLNLPTQEIGKEQNPELPFWAKNHSEWPYFMQVVGPYKHKDWANLLLISTLWTEKEPDSSGAWYYLAVAEYYKHDFISSEAHFRKSISLTDNNIEAYSYLSQLESYSGKHLEALRDLEILISLDEKEGNKVKKIIFPE